MAMQKPWAKPAGNSAARVRLAAASASHPLRSAASGTVTMPLFKSFVCWDIGDGLRGSV